jgi:hypothetical protein
VGGQSPPRKGRHGRVGWWFAPTNCGSAESTSSRRRRGSEWHACGKARRQLFGPPWASQRRVDGLLTVAAWEADDRQVKEIAPIACERLRLLRASYRFRCQID